MSDTISKFTIQGMHCDACQRVITKKLSQLPEVQIQKLEPTGELELASARKISTEEVAHVLEGTHYTVSA